jgi:hypothetical protein
MSKQSNPSKAPTSETTTPKAVPDRDDREHVPELAENFEHTLRRLIRQRDEDRARNSGLYR